MKIGIVSDHRGYIIKQMLTSFLIQRGYNIVDYGTDSEDSVDYPIYAFKLGEKILSQEVSLGIAICGTGIGMSIALNKIKGIRCAKVNSTEEAELARSHNDAQVIALSSTLSQEDLKNITLSFLRTNFSNEKKHINRIKEISEYEND